MKNITGNWKRRSKIFGLLACLLICSSSLFAQQELPFQPGEQLDFVIYYKYGIMVKGGNAQYLIRNSTFKGQPAIRTGLTFKTTGLLDAAYKVKDTLYSYFTPELLPIAHHKFLHEGKTIYTEKIEYKEFSEEFTSVQSKRIRPDGSLRFDTLLTAKGIGLDMLSIFAFIRTIDYPNLKAGDKILITSFVAKDAIPVYIRYIGQSIVDKGSVKYKALQFGIDFVADAFTDPKNAMEIWISDDENHIPLKLRAKLKIGAAEAELTSAKNLKYPFDAKIEIRR